MGNLKQIKSKEERLKEGLSILNQLMEAGVNQHMGFKELKDRISEWVKSGESWSGTISFSEHGRIAEVDLPKYNNRAAGLNFKVKRAF